MRTAVPASTWNYHSFSPMSQRFRRSRYTAEGKHFPGASEKHQINGIIGSLFKMIVFCPLFMHLRYFSLTLFPGRGRRE
ncbi:hypothetical protein CEXT_669211 [Caerostris extrusa]|uniref:Uncharacterized protein n=1 Tax=Caerostris extrusa TaxID=172846 RepID=A0AAV4MHL7_CAEEX|nr:hypothetical protein CEXT_669211 [Caerostris extrusa]